jgi:1-acyl-sn-glycerol-3-phosphate acyltransferase
MYQAFKIIRPISFRFWKVRVEGEEHIPATGPAILAANHASFLDPWFYGFHIRKRDLHNLINARWYNRSGFWQRFFDAGGAVPIAPGDVRETSRRVGAALGEGKIILIYPEGRISRDGRLGPGRSGTGFLAAQHGVPVIPCGARGNFDILPAHRRIPRRRPLRLRIGEPMVFPGSPVSHPDRTSVRAFVDELMERIRILSGAGLQEPSLSAR